MKQTFYILLLAIFISTIISYGNNIIDERVDQKVKIIFKDIKENNKKYYSLKLNNKEYDLSKNLDFNIVLEKFINSNLSHGIDNATFDFNNYNNSKKYYISYFGPTKIYNNGGGIEISYHIGGDQKILLKDGDLELFNKLNKITNIDLETYLKINEKESLNFDKIESFEIEKFKVGDTIKYSLRINTKENIVTISGESFDNLSKEEIINLINNFL